MLNTMPSDSEYENLSEIASFNTFLSILTAVVVGVTIAVIILPNALPGLYISLIGINPKAFWFLARGSAIAAYITLWLSMVLGLMMTAKIARRWPGNAAASNIHQFISLLGIGFALFHAMILLGDRFIGFSLVNLWIPFSNNLYRPFWVGIGQIGLYLWLIIVLSFYLRKSIGVKGWRLIHYASFLLYLVALLHGILSGTDSNQLWAALLYWSSGGILLWLFLFRILLRGQTFQIDKPLHRENVELADN